MASRTLVPGRSPRRPGLPSDSSICSIAFPVCRQEKDLLIRHRDSVMQKKRGLYAAPSGSGRHRRGPRVRDMGACVCASGVWVVPQCAADGEVHLINAEAAKVALRACPRR